MFISNIRICKYKKQHQCCKSFKLPQNQNLRPEKYHATNFIQLLFKFLQHCPACLHVATVVTVVVMHIHSIFSICSTH